MNNVKLLKKLILTSLLMFAFAFALVPLYDVFCDITGLNGKPNMEQAQVSAQSDESRSVRVTFITHAQAGAPFKVKAKRYSVDVSPGEMERIEFIAQNLSSSNKIMQAVPSVAPGRAAKYLHKVSCFCFNQQPLTSKGSADLPLLFYLDETLPNDIHEVTLSYTIYDITADVEGKVASNRKRDGELVNENSI